MDKKEFIKYLKNITDTLEKDEIRYELPYCHIDKTKFDYMDIIIPDHIQGFDISKLFTCTKIKEKESIIDCEIDGFKVRFIKTSEKDWFYTFYYYCWNVVPVFVDILSNKVFGLRYKRNGLKYIYKEKNINISKNMKTIFDFLELKMQMVINGFPTDYTIYSFIQASPYYDTEYFTLETFKEFDPMFEYNKHYYEEFIKIKRESKGERKKFEEQIALIDAYFKDANFLEELSKIQLKDEYPNLKEKPNIIKPDPKTIDDLLKEKSEEVQKEKNKKKIKLGKIVDNKDDDDFDFRIE